MLVLALNPCQNEALWNTKPLVTFTAQVTASTASRVGSRSAILQDPWVTSLVYLPIHESPWFLLGTLKKVGQQFNAETFCGDLNISIYLQHIYIYIWSPPPGPIRALGAGVIILDNYIINMITCSKTLQIPVNASWMHMTLNTLTFQKGKTPISWKQNLSFEKGQIYL